MRETPLLVEMRTAPECNAVLLGGLGRVGVYEIVASRDRLHQAAGVSQNVRRLFQPCNERDELIVCHGSASIPGARAYCMAFEWSFVDCGSCVATCNADHAGCSSGSGCANKTS